MMGTGHVLNRPDQLTINQVSFNLSGNIITDKYAPGAGIPAHVDTHSAFGPELISLSLGSPIIMDFRHPQEDIHIPIYLPPRSLLVLTGEARYVWR